MKVDWNPVNNLIVSGGEDRKYKVWDSYGEHVLIDNLLLLEASLTFTMSDISKSNFTNPQAGPSTPPSPRTTL